MTVELYNAIIKPRARVTSMDLVQRGEGILKAGTEVENPTIERLQLTVTPSKINYMYIPEFGRFYFVTNRESAPNPSNFWNISGHVDVLSSMWSQLQNQGAILRRQTHAFNLYLDDPMFPVQANRSPQILTFPKGFTASQNGACCVVTLIGADS